jgi:protein involved in polysaccharide export with SLBB domain
VFEGSGVLQEAFGSSGVLERPNYRTPELSNVLGHTVEHPNVRTVIVGFGLDSKPAAIYKTTFPEPGEVVGGKAVIRTRLKQDGWRPTPLPTGGTRKIRRQAGAGKIRSWLAAALAVYLAMPLPAPAQAPPGLPVTGLDGDVQIERRAGTPRAVRELSAFPTITIVEPRNGALVTREDQPVNITFRDPRDELDLSTFRVFINGVDRTRQFQVSPSGATWRPQPRRGPSEAVRDLTLERQGREIEARALGIAELQPVLTEGQNTVVASIKNLSGNLATTSAAFVLDTSTLLATRAAPRSPLEQAFLQPPSPPLSETARRGTPAGPSVSRDLTQFGYEAFRTLLPTLGPASNLPVSPDYTLGPGDSLILYVWNIPGGALYDSATLVLDRTGSAFVPRVGSVPLQGLTLAQAQEVLKTRLARYYSGFELRVALGELRAIGVYVVGEVTRPGTYTISPFSTVLDGLFAAGGPTKMGTLRAIRVTRNGQTLGEVDLYEFLLRGERAIGPPLQAGDTIFVPPIGPVAAITGEVKRPAIYELRPGTSLAALVAMSGGPLPTAQLERVQVERVQGASGKAILDVSLAGPRGSGGSEPLQDGDLVTVFPGQDRLHNAITLEGFVRTPGQYEWKPGMRLSHLLRPDVVLPEAYRERVEVVRVRPDFSREVLSVDLRELWAGNPTPNPARDIPLEPMDRISVQSEVVGPATVTLSGEVKRPGTYVITKGERLSSVLRRAGGFTERAYPKAAVFTRESVRKREKAQLEDFVRVQEERIFAETSAVAAGGESAAPLRESLIQRRALLRMMADRVVVGRIVLRLGDPDQLEGSEADIPLEDGDTLSVPMRPSAVLVLGSVRNPTAVLYQPGAPAEFYVEKAGGLNKDADRDEVHIVRADGSAMRGYAKVREMEPGDTILAPSSVEPKYRPLPVWRDVATIVGQFALTIASMATLFK